MSLVARANQWSVLGSRDIDGQTEEGERAGSERVNLAIAAGDAGMVILVPAVVVTMITPSSFQSPGFRLGNLSRFVD
jgi:hypothetical protein